jgi:hypothetical protein
MPDLYWDEVKNFFDPNLMGVLPDVVVPGASAEDRQDLFDLVQAQLAVAVLGRQQGAAAAPGC